MTNRAMTTTLDRMLTLNRALDQALGSAISGAGRARVWMPAMDVAERADAYVVHLELPGVDPQQVEVSFEQNVLMVKGTKPSAYDMSAEGELRVYSNERVHGAFERSVRLPEFVDSERIEAGFQNGLLTVVVPKAQAAQPRRIEVKVG